MSAIYDNSHYGEITRARPQIVMARTKRSPSGRRIDAETISAIAPACPAATGPGRVGSAWVGSRGAEHEGGLSLARTYVVSRRCAICCEAVSGSAITASICTRTGRAGHAVIRPATPCRGQRASVLSPLPLVPDSQVHECLKERRRVCKYMFMIRDASTRT